MGRESLTIRAAAMLLFDRLYRLAPALIGAAKLLLSLDCSGDVSLGLLRRDILRGDEAFTLEENVISEIFLDNLKSATPWVIKLMNIRLLKDFARSGAAPFCTSRRTLPISSRSATASLSDTTQATRS